MNAAFPPTQHLPMKEAWIQKEEQKVSQPAKEDTEPKPPSPSVGATFSTFFGVTTAHGFSHLNSHAFVGRIFWILILLATMVGVSFHLYEVIGNYLEYQYTDAVKVLAFPFILFKGRANITL